eukprot:EG_transcript_8606
MATVWERLYEDGVDRMEQRYMEEEQPFSFQPDISEAQEAYRGEEGEVFERLYSEGVNQREHRLTRHDAHWQQFPYRPNNSRAFDAECWNRLYQDGMETKQRLTRRMREPTTESLTFKPKITPYFTKEGTPGPIYERLYEEARLKKEAEERRKAELAEALKSQYGFKPTIASAGLGRKDVHRELYEDAFHKKARVEELVRRVQTEREQEAVSETGSAPPRRGRRPAPEEEEEEPIGPFVPKINDVRGVAPRYMLPKRRFEPLHSPATPLDAGGRQPWISPLEADSQERAERDRGGGAARRSRSAGAEWRNASSYTAPEQPVGRYGLRPVRSASTADSGSMVRRIRAKSEEGFMRPTMSSALRSPSHLSPPSPPSGRFHYVPDAEDPHQHGRTLDFNRGDQFQVRTSPPRAPPQSISGLRMRNSPGRDRGDATVAATPASPGRGLSGSGLPVKWDAPVHTSVSRTVSRETRTIDLT